MTDIFHITAVDNLAALLEAGGLCSESERARRGIEITAIGHAHIKNRRGSAPVPLPPGGVINDYVPFYFAPRSPMLFAISKGNVQGYTQGQEPILHLRSAVELAADARLDFVFTDGQAAMALSRFYDDTAHLDKIDWGIMRAQYWADTMEDNDRCRRRLAEFLIHGFAPWELIVEIGVCSAAIRDRVMAEIASAAHRPPVCLRREWYY